MGLPGASRLVPGILTSITPSSTSCSAIHQVNIQTAPPGQTARTVIREMMQDGVSPLFRGVCSPVLLVGLWKAVLFGGYSGSIAMMPASTVKENPLACSAGAAAVGAFAGGLISNPLELIKCRAQTQLGAEVAPKSESLMRVEFDLLKEVLRTRGMSGLFRGMTATLVTSVPSTAGWLVMNESLLQAVYKHYGCRSSFLVTMLVGALSGSVSWLMAYPFDVIKAMRMTAPEGQYDSYRCLLRDQVRANKGYGFLWRGFNVTILRSMPQLGITMAVYDVVGRSLHNHNDGQQPATY